MQHCNNKECCLEMRDGKRREIFVSRVNSNSVLVPISILTTASFLDTILGIKFDGTVAEGLDLLCL